MYKISSITMYEIHQHINKIDLQCVTIKNKLIYTQYSQTFRPLGPGYLRLSLGLHHTKSFHLFSLLVSLAYIVSLNRKYNLDTFSELRFT